MIQIFSAVFYTNGLMRMRLTSDASKMVISTMNGLLCYSGSSDLPTLNNILPGYLVVIHDLDLNTMCEDLAGFKPNMYRLMQLSGKVGNWCQELLHNSFFQALELAINYTQLFHAKRNRVEIISDFPDGNDAEVTFVPAT